MGRFFIWSCVAAWAVIMAALIFAVIGVSRAEAGPIPASTPVSALAMPPGPAPGHFTAVEPHLVMEMSGPSRSKPETRDGRTLWAVGKPIVYRTLAGDLITVPAGMTTDLASIPRLVSGAIPPDGPWARAAVVHDFLFETSGSCMLKQKDLRTGKVFTYPNGCTRKTPYTRSEANEVLRQAMVALGVTAWKRVVIYEGVVAGGVVAPSAWGR
jgi:hypothetical protein